MGRIFGNMDSTIIEYGVYLLIGLSSVKMYFTFEGRKTDRIEEGREKRAETYANGKVREARVEMQADQQGFNDVAGGDEPDTMTAIMNFANSNPELVEKFLKKT